MSGNPRTAGLVSWKPGQSGNPSGKRSSAVKLAELIAKETDNGQEIIAFVLAVLRGRTVEPPVGKAKVGRTKKWNDKSRLWAAEWLGDRYWGKAKQVVEFESTSQAQQTNYDKLDDLDLAELDRIMTKAMDAGSDQPDPSLMLPGEVIPIEPAPDSE